MILPDTQLLLKAKYHCTADLLLYCFGFNQARTSADNFYLTEQLNQDQSNRRSSVQSEWVFYNLTHCGTKIIKRRAEVVAQLLDQLLQLRRSAVRIQSPAKFILNLYCQLYWKGKNKEKRDRELLILLKKNNKRGPNLFLPFDCRNAHHDVCVIHVPGTNTIKLFLR